MSLAPLLDLAHLFRALEVMAVCGFAKPPPLAGHLAGVAASGFGAVMLALEIAVIREEKLVTATALTSRWPRSHRDLKSARAERKSKHNSPPEEGPGRKKEEAFWRESKEAKAAEENTISNRRL
ncbi:MAG: hypothetical protein ABSH34_12505 [Verrucomicrobiota bacterium]|jgi:hypothetical protein